MVYLYGPESIVSLYVGQHFQRTPESEGLTIGTPLIEASDPQGLVERRALVAYPFTGEQVAFARKVIVANVARGFHADGVDFNDRFPADWRWPAVGAGGSPEVEAPLVAAAVDSAQLVRSV